MFSLIRSALEDGASSGGADDDLKPPPFDSERTLALEGLCTKDGGEVSHVNGLSCCQFPAIPGNLPSKECFPSVDA